MIAILRTSRGLSRAGASVRFFGASTAHSFYCVPVEAVGYFANSSSIGVDIHTMRTTASKTTTTTTSRFSTRAPLSLRAPSFVVALAVAMSDGGRAGASSTAQRRRERRLRAAWRHEQLSVRIALAAAGDRRQPGQRQVCSTSVSTSTKHLPPGGSRA